MCKLEDNNEKIKEREGYWMFLRLSHAGMKLWVLRAISTILLWTCIIQLSWPSCSSLPDMYTVNNVSFLQPKLHYPPKRVYNNNGYLVVSCNGGLNQMRAVADPSDFQDIFDVDHFITSLRDEARIMKELPPRLKRRAELGMFYELPPVIWSNISYYHRQILPLIQKHKVLHLNKTDAHLANNGLPLEIQKLRCRVNFSSLRFTDQIEELGRKVVRILRQMGPFLVLHLRYEMDMLSFSGCTPGCNTEEVNELTTMRYANPRWKEKVIDPELKRKQGLCPLTPEETALVLTTLGIDCNIQIYIAAGKIYGGERRLSSFLKLVGPKGGIAGTSDLRFSRNHSSQMAALDYLFSLASNCIFLVGLIDQYNDGSVGWEDFSSYVKEAHAVRMGRPKERDEDYFYENPEECLGADG
ncbi:hypothetical protein Pfo_019512 [Paulownia fortunei]|nr:hypothetical protein Pfo_019512 [Paulownia fortunei]